MRNWKRRVSSLLLVCCLLAALWPVGASATVVASGTCGGEGDGSNLTWTLDDAGTLTISGTGKMADYANSDYAPWYGSRENVVTAVIDNGCTSIGRRAFVSCTKLVSVIIPGSVAEIGYGAFEYCFSLADVTIPNGVATIGGSAFSSCSKLVSVTIPSSISEIADGAFARCRDLTNITVEEPNGYYSSEDGVLYNDDKTAIICCPGARSGTFTIPDGVATIFWMAFGYCNNLTSVTIPGSVVSIRGYAFCDCSSLTSVTIPSSIAEIGYGAFSRCSSLTSITVDEANNYYSSEDGILYNGDKTEIICCPGGWNGAFTVRNHITLIGLAAFDGCENLTSVTIPYGVTGIGPAAFQGCKKLTSVTIPSSLSSIGDNAFNIPSLRGGLMTVYYQGTEEQKSQISIKWGNNVLLNAEWIYGFEPDTPDTPEPTFDTPLTPNAIRYVQYSNSLATSTDGGTSYTVVSNSRSGLPSGLTLSGDGKISGIPLEYGTFEFSVLETTAAGTQQLDFTLVVENNTLPKNRKSVGAGFVIEETVPDFDVSDFTDRKYVINTVDGGDDAFDQFDGLYLDGIKLVGGVRESESDPRDPSWEYEYKRGSWEAVVYEETFRKYGAGDHTLNANFSTTDETTGEVVVKAVAVTYTAKTADNAPLSLSASLANGQWLSYTVSGAADGGTFTVIVAGYENGRMTGVTILNDADAAGRVRVSAAEEYRVFLVRMADGSPIPLCPAETVAGEG